MSNRDIAQEASTKHNLQHSSGSKLVKVILYQILGVLVLCVIQSFLPSFPYINCMYPLAGILAWSLGLQYLFLFLSRLLGDVNLLGMKLDIGKLRTAFGAHYATQWPWVIVTSIVYITLILGTIYLGSYGSSPLAECQQPSFVEHFAIIPASGGAEYRGPCLMRR